MKIYLASSWRNQKQPAILNALRLAGHHMYDFTSYTPHPGDGVTPETFAFDWKEVDPEWTEWTMEQYVKCLEHETAIKGFKSDFEAMLWADVCVLTLPCNRSAHLELGWFLGQNKKGFILLEESTFEPELMYRLSDGVFTNVFALITHLARIKS